MYESGPSLFAWLTAGWSRRDDGRGTRLEERDGWYVIARTLQHFHLTWQLPINVITLKNRAQPGMKGLLIGKPLIFFHSLAIVGDSRFGFGYCTITPVACSMARIFGLALMALAVSSTTRAFATGPHNVFKSTIHGGLRTRKSPILASLCSTPQHHVLNAGKGMPVLNRPLPSSSLAAAPSSISSIAPILFRRGGVAIPAPPGKGFDFLTLLSRTTGYVVIAGSMLFKLPQAARIFRKKSAAGLSSSMYILETIGIAMSLAFSIRNAFPFSTYGETVFIVLQNVVIMAGISLYSDEPRPPILALSLLLASLFFAYTISPLAPMLLVSILQTVSIPLLNFSRVPQLLLNYRNKSTGELAPSTLILQAVGNVARIFTTMVQLQNTLYLLSCVAAFIFNGALVAQYYLYRDRAPVKDA